ncbi:alpha/beta hydrolase family protein [Arenicella xantha]|uniref:Serine aminopeptidase S33 family n=1 Tax=Arenicella xantha TaxID=644221 RepID=A0A395JIF0_9GAMM|nr:alpha/beta fold hydrolase [Arenicella xantha]RBP49910.1 serine aminopeptidase S33 family [Arenicella xantha]
MNLVQGFMRRVLLCILVSTTLNSNAAPTASQSLASDYLSQWFSYDSSVPIDLTMTTLARDQIGERAELRFLSDDGQAVNGLIAFPSNHSSLKPKLAFALHPMGTNQQFWWSESSALAAQNLTSHLRQKGYIVISLDARLHGERGRQGFGPRELIARAHSDEPRLYIDTIIGSVRDYRLALHWALQEFDPQEVLVMGYSMGAQMSLLLASLEPSVTTVLAMVPPYVESAISPVAPRVHVPAISKAKVLWLAGRDDPYSSKDQTEQTFEQIGSQDKTVVWFDSGHRLPPDFIEVALSFFDSLQDGGSNE